jgi:hypothetical protein
MTLAASPGVAKTTHKVSCKQIKEALASGKSAEEVATDLKTSVSRVNSCSKSSAKKSHKSTSTAKQ